MFTRISISQPFRSVHPNFWHADAIAGKRTVIFGANGSGKSTISELLYGQSAEMVEVPHIRYLFEVEHDAVTDPTNHDLHVFTSYWIENNLDNFLNGKTAGAVVTLGAAAIEHRKEIEQAKRTRDELRTRYADTKTAYDKQKQLLVRLARDAQQEIGALSDHHDLRQYSKTRYNITKVQRILAEPYGSHPDPDSISRANATLRERQPSQVRIPSPPSLLSDIEISDAYEILRRSPTNIVLTELVENPAAERWVQDGVELHEDRASCYFCGSAIPPERLTVLNNHFNDALRLVQRRCQELRTRISNIRNEWYDYPRSLPEILTLAPDLREEYRSGSAEMGDESERYLEFLKQLDANLAFKEKSPTAVIESSEPPSQYKIDSTAKLSAILRRHNGLVAKWDSERASAAELLFREILARHAPRYTQEFNRCESLGRTLEEIREEGEATSNHLHELEAQHYSTARTAEAISRDLQSIYGPGRLRVETSPTDPNSYVCIRGEIPATNLSEGERRTVALAYFLRSLEDSRNTVPLKDRVVVVDDPSTSLDREALFATQAWLDKRLESFGQVVIFTHDYNFLKLWLEAYGKRAKKERKNRAQPPAGFPSISFLEVRAEGDGLQRHSVIRKLPNYLLDARSEYVDLFARLHNAYTSTSDDRQDSAILPNLARQFLEVYCNFHSPHETSFRNRLTKTFETTLTPDEILRIYRFCNTYSHANVDAITAIVDEEAILDEFRSCVRLVVGADPQHLSRLRDVLSS